MNSCKRKLHPSRRNYTAGGALLTVIFLIGLLMLTSSAVLSAVTNVILFRPSPGSAYQLYIPGTRSICVLQGTENMNNAVIGDIDNDGFEDDIVYTDGVKGGLGYYTVPSDGVWRSSYARSIANVPRDAVPLAVVKTGRKGKTPMVVYKSASTGQAYAIRKEGNGRLSLGKMDRAYAIDATNTGFKGDLLWWTNGVGMKWRKGLTGADVAAPFSDWIPIGEGSVASSLPGRKIVFLASKDTSPTLYICDTKWNYTKIDGTTWSWSANIGSTAVGDINGDKIAEIVYSQGSSEPLSWYHVPAAASPWNSNGVVSESGIRCGWNIHGVTSMDVKASTPVEPPPTTTVPVPAAYIKDLRDMADGTLITLNAKPRTKLVRERDASGNIVTTGFYIEENDQSAGIRVVGNTQAVEGQYVSITGTLATLGGERVIQVQEQTMSKLVSKILAISTTVGTVYANALLAGVLAQVTGDISSANLAEGWFMLKDGDQAVKIYCVDNMYTSGRVTLTGCLGAEIDLTGNPVPVVRVESSSDIAVIPTTPEISYSVWTKSSLAKVWKNDPIEPLKAVNIKAAKNEQEAFQVVLRGGSTRVDSVAVTASDLVSAAGTISSANVKILTVGYINLPDFAVDHPDPMPPYTGPFTLAAGETKPLYISVFVPKTASAGDYTGKLTLSDTSGASVEVPYTLRVYNFTLPDDPKMASAMNLWGGEIAQQHKQSEYTSTFITTQNNYVKFMMDCGLSSYGLPYPRTISNSEGAAYMTSPRITAFAAPYSSDRTSMTNNINRFVSLGVLHKAYDYTEDEPAYMSEYEKIKARCNYLHSINPKYRTMVTIHDFCHRSNEPIWAGGNSYSPGDLVGHYGRAHYALTYVFRCKLAHVSQAGTNEPWSGSNWRAYWEMVDPMVELAGYVDIWAIGSQQWPVFASQAAARLAAGDTVWAYMEFGVARTDESPRRIQPTMETRLQPWICYRYGAVGMLQWRINWWQGCLNGDPWQGIKNCSWGYAQGMHFYPGYQVGVNGPVTSMRFEHTRDSMEDYQYLWLLEQKVGRDAVMNYVNQLCTSWKSYSTDINKLESIRDQIAKAIEN